jgi:hypothetical protein
MRVIVRRQMLGRNTMAIGEVRALSLAFGGSVAYLRWSTGQVCETREAVSYNNRTMKLAMLPFSAFWVYEESISYVLPMR